MRYLKSVTSNEVMEKYNVIIGWGASYEFLKVYDKSDLKIDYLVDGKNYNVGSEIYGITVSPLDSLEKFKDDSSVLVVIYSNVEHDIVNRINKMLPKADTICARLVKSSNKKAGVNLFNEWRRSHIV